MSRSASIERNTKETHRFSPNRNGEQMAASWEIYSNLRRSGVLDAPLGI